MGKWEIKWNSEKILALSAMSISFITLVFFIYQTNLMSRQNYLSILPYLDMSTTENNEQKIFELNLKNHGVGPAIIESASITYEGTTYDLRDYEDNVILLLTELEPELDNLNDCSFSTLDRGMAIPANTIYNVLMVRNEDYEIFTRNIEMLLVNGMRWDIIYKSIQDERWLIHNNSEGPEKLE